MISYGTIYRSLLWPTYEQMRGRNAHRYLQRMEKNQWLPSAKLLQFQIDELRKLLVHSANQSPWYSTHFEKAGVKPHSMRLPDDLLRLSPITKSDINANRATIQSRNFMTDGYEHSTGGSTGIPLRFYVNRDSYEWRLATTARGYAWAGYRDGDRQFYVWGAPIGTPPWHKRIKARLHNAVLRRRVFSSFNFSKSAMSHCVGEICRFRPQTIVGYTNALYLLAQHILENKLPIWPPHAVITAAEGVNTIQRDVIQHAFEAPVFASYGSREFMLIAMECEKHQGLHISSDNLHVEVVRPDGTPALEGEIGEILVTDLHNFGTPFIRYKIGDLGVLTSRTCPCGRGLPLLERIEGRTLDAIRTPDGRIVPGEYFPHLMKEFGIIKQFQVIQKRLDMLQISVVLSNDSSITQLLPLKQEIQKTLGQHIRIVFDPVTAIPQTGSGKFRVTISELPNSTLSPST